MAFLSIPLKKTKEIDFTQALKNYISQSLSTFDNPENCESEISEFNRLRSISVCRFVDQNENSLNLLYKYYDQLCAAECKLPFDENHIHITFKWKEAFESYSLFGSKISAALVSGEFEKACVLFNIAALKSQIACNQNDSDDGMKISVKYFQQSAGIFNFLKEMPCSFKKKEVSLDLSNESLATLSMLMLAQAQEVIYKKAKKDKSNGIIAKICYQCAQMFSEAYKLMNQQSIKSQFDKEWFQNVLAKCTVLLALSHFHQSKVANEEKKFGLELGHLTHAFSLCSAVNTSYPHLNEDAILIESAFNYAKKENDFIYHEVVVPSAELPSIQKVTLVKNILPTFPLSAKFTDLFSKITPLVVQKAVVAFDLRKSELINIEIAKMREATQLLNGCLASLNLPAALEDFVTGGLCLPPSLVEKCDRVKSMGGVRDLTHNLNELPQLLRRNKDILEQVINELDQELREDAELRSLYTYRWNRTDSKILQQPLRQEASSYQQTIDSAIKADIIVREKYDSNLTNIQILCKSPSEILNIVPSGAGTASNIIQPIVKKMKSLLEQVDTLLKERTEIEKRLTTIALPDINDKFMKAYAEDNSFDEFTVSSSILSEYYDTFTSEICTNIKLQEKLLSSIQEGNNDFVSSSKNVSSASSSQRESVLKSLATSYEAFIELAANLKEGIHFYNDLTPILVKFQTKATDLCLARKTEKNDLLKDLQNSASSGHTQKSAPPKRPPPPNSSLINNLTTSSSSSKPSFIYPKHESSLKANPYDQSSVSDDATDSYNAYYSNDQASMYSQPDYHTYRPYFQPYATMIPHSFNPFSFVPSTNSNHRSSTPLPYPVSQPRYPGYYMNPRPH